MLLSWLRSLAHAIAENPGPWRLMLIPSEETPAVVREHVQRGPTLALEQARTLIGPLLGVEPASGRVDRELAAQTMLAAAEHAAKLLIRDPSEYTPERLVASAQSLLARR